MVNNFFDSCPKKKSLNSSSKSFLNFVDSTEQGFLRKINIYVMLHKKKIFFLFSSDRSVVHLVCFAVIHHSDPSEAEPTKSLEQRGPTNIPRFEDRMGFLHLRWSIDSQRSWFSLFFSHFREREKQRRATCSYR